MSMPAVAPAAATSAAIRRDFDLLQGSWVTIAGPKEARLLVAGHRYAFEFVGGEVYIGTFDLAPGGEMDMCIQEGPEDHKGQVAPCLYHVEGNGLKWCPGRIGSGRRLSAFPSVDDAKYLCLMFRRVPRR
jgi:hypothetical protein